MTPEEAWPFDELSLGAETASGPYGLRASPVSTSRQWDHPLKRSQTRESEKASSRTPSLENARGMEATAQRN